MVMDKDRQPSDEPPAVERVGSTGEMTSDVSQEELEALLKKVDKESTFRKLIGFDHWLVFWIAVAFSGFHVYTAMFGMLAAQMQRSVHQRSQCQYRSGESKFFPLHQPYRQFGQTQHELPHPL